MGYFSVLLVITTQPGEVPKKRFREIMLVVLGEDAAEAINIAYHTEREFIESNIRHGRMFVSMVRTATLAEIKMLDSLPKQEETVPGVAGRLTPC